MGDLLPLWVGLGLILMLVLFAGGGGKTSKKQAARIDRITRSKPAGLQAAAQSSLRRKDPNQATPLGQMLSSVSSISKLQGRLEVAGMNITSQKFLTYMGVVALAVTFIVTVILGKPFILGLLLGILAGLALPNMVVSRKIRKRQLLFLKLFPEAIDLMVRGLRAGLPVTESFQTVSRELPPPMGDTFATISQQTALGMPLEKALSDTAVKIGLTEFNFFVTTIILQRETGGNLGEILSNLSEMLRQRHMMKLKIGALSSEARASAYIVGALPFVVFMLLMLISPDYLRPLFNDYRGNMALAAAGGSMGLGAFIMRKMTQLEI